MASASLPKYFRQSYENLSVARLGEGRIAIFVLWEKFNKEIHKILPKNLESQLFLHINKNFW